MMTDRYLSFGLVFLLLTILVNGLLSCGHSKSQMAPRVNPMMSKTEIWHEKGIVIWSKVPLTVYVKPAKFISEMKTDTYISTWHWNVLIGCDIFKVVEKPDADIVVKFTARPKVYGDSVVADSTYVRRGKGYRSRWGNDIRLFEISVKDSLHRINVMQHELGHALGLRDLYKASERGNVMHGNSRYGTEVDPAAIAFFRREYCAR